MNTNARVCQIQTYPVQPTVATSNIGALRLVGGLHIGLGMVCGILGIVGAILSKTKIDSRCESYYYYHRYSYVITYTCYSLGDAILIMDLICVGLSGWFTLTGCLPLCMTVQRKSSCLADFYANASGVVAVSVLLTVLSFIECIVSIVAACYCCCCSQLSTGNHQDVQQGYDQVGNSGIQGYDGNPLNSQQWVYPTAPPADIGYEFPVVDEINSNQRVYPTAPPADIDQSFPIEDNSTTN